MLASTRVVFGYGYEHTLLQSIISWTSQGDLASKPSQTQNVHQVVVVVAVVASGRQACRRRCRH